MLVSLLEIFLNKLIMLDPYAQQQLAGLSNKKIVIYLKQLNFGYLMQFNHHGQLVDGQIKRITNINQCKSANLIIKIIDKLAILDIVVTGKLRKAIRSGKISLHGDIKLSGKLEKIYNNYQINCYQAMSKIPVVGEQLNYLCRVSSKKVNTGVKQITENYQQNLTSYLQDELEQLPSRSMVDDFINQVDELRMQLDRLTSKVKFIKDVYN